MKLLIFTINAIGPLILLILLGYYLKHIHFFKDEFLRDANKMVFRIFLPVFLFYNVYKIDNLQSIPWISVGYALCIIIAIYFIGMIIIHFFVHDPKQKGVILQCAFRSNYAIIGLPMAVSLGNEDAVSFAVALTAFTIPVYNILAVIALSIYVDDDHGKINWRRVIHNILTNPLIIAIGLGFILVCLRSFIPKQADGDLVFSLEEAVPLLFDVIKELAGVASPLALIVMGGLFEIKEFKNLYPQILIGTILRTVIAPLIGLGIAILLSRIVPEVAFSQREYPAYIALFSTPVAVSSAIMAKEMNNDEQLASQLVVWTSIFSMGTIFIIIVGMKYFGYL